MNPPEADKKAIWKKVYDYMATVDPEGFGLMNYGYAGDPPLELTAEEENERYALQHYAQAASAVDLHGKKVLEVGCGRGGGAAFCRRRFQPAELHGIDFSEKAIEICRHRYGSIPGLSFQWGDAAQLPFGEAEIDAVINIESSHCYPSRPAFYQEVWRVLRPGGDFLYADFFPVAETWAGELKDAGFEVQKEADITPQVLRSMDQDHERKAALFQDIPQPRRGYLENWAGLRGSPIYESFRSGETIYVSYHLTKRLKP